jgi:hypothetical protein
MIQLGIATIRATGTVRFLFCLFVLSSCISLKNTGQSPKQNRDQAVEIHFTKNLLVGEPYEFTVSVMSDSADSFMTPLADFSSVGLPHVYILNDKKLNYLYNISNTYVYGDQVSIYTRGTYRIKVYVEWSDGSFCNKSLQFRVL